MTTFSQLGLNENISKSLMELGFSEAYPVQQQTIPYILENKQDLIALAQTGTGKTAGYGLPIIQQIDPSAHKPQALILAPTRELCLQISQDLKKYAKYSDSIAVAAVYGGERIDLQIRALKKGADIVVGTPGRAHDLIRRKVLKPQSIRWLVLDEADEMMDMGFKEELNAILEETPKDRQTLLFSATMSKNVFNIAKQYMNDAREISVGEKNAGADMVSHRYFLVNARDRFEALRRILDSLPGVYGILFCRTRRETQEVADKLKQADYDAEALHGEISQAMRTQIMNRFKNKQIRLLVATDVAARGIDVNDLTHVINYNLPDQNEVYTHRSGRTGRAQKSGISMTIVSPREKGRIRQLEKMIGQEFTYQEVPGGEAILKNQLAHMMSSAESTAEGRVADWLKPVVKELSKLTKDELISLLAQDKFGKLAAKYAKARDISAKPEKTISRGRGNADQTALKINIGKVNGLDVKGFFNLINSKKKTKGLDVGRIELGAQTSVFTVDQSAAGSVIAAFGNMKFQGRKINISRTSDRPNYRGKGKKPYAAKGRKPKGGYGGKKGRKRS